MVGVSFLVDGQRHKFLLTAGSIPAVGEIVALRGGMTDATYRVVSRSWYFNLGDDRHDVDIILKKTDPRQELTKMITGSGEAG